MNNVINLPEKLSPEEAIREGMMKLDDALSFLDNVDDFVAKTLASMVYGTLRAGEAMLEEGLDK